MGYFAIAALVLLYVLHRLDRRFPPRVMITTGGGRCWACRREQMDAVRVGRRHHDCLLRGAR